MAAEWSYWLLPRGRSVPRAAPGTPRPLSALGRCAAAGMDPPVPPAFKVLVQRLQAAIRLPMHSGRLRRKPVVKGQWPGHAATLFEQAPEPPSAGAGVQGLVLVLRLVVGPQAPAASKPLRAIDDAAPAATAGAAEPVASAAKLRGRRDNGKDLGDRDAGAVCAQLIAQPQAPGLHRVAYRSSFDAAMAPGDPRDAVRPLEAHPQARPPPVAQAPRRTRRVHTCSHRPEPASARQAGGTVASDGRCVRGVSVSRVEVAWRALLRGRRSRRFHRSERQQGSQRHSKKPPQRPTPISSPTSATKSAKSGCRIGICDAHGLPMGNAHRGRKPRPQSQ
jgi:hypothetical protein